MGNSRPKSTASPRAGVGCICYVRYSPRPAVMRDAEGDAETLTGQTEACRRFAESRGWMVLAVRKDEEKTGRGNGKNRRGLMQAIDECKRAGAVLVIAKLDRLSRDVEFISSLLKSEIEFVAVDMPHATKVTIQIMAVMAEYESDCISKRTRESMRSMQARGRVVGSVPPFGWKHGKEFEVVKNGMRVRRWMMQEDEREQAVLRRLRELVRGGTCDYRVATMLNAEGMPSRSKAWSAVTVGKVRRRDEAAGGKFSPKGAE